MRRLIVAAVMAATPVSAAEILAGPYPAEIMRVLDGDTVEARVRVWLDTDVTTLVRIRGIDAPELHGHCPGERDAARASRAHLEMLLGSGPVWLSDIGHDKYGRRIDATMTLPSGVDVGESMRDAGHAAAAGHGRVRRCG
jgi:endonuclease YncB( thermonuclease family)